MEIVKYYRNSQISIVLEIGIEHKNEFEYNLIRNIVYPSYEINRIDEDYKDKLLKKADNIFNKIKKEALKNKLNNIDKIADLICLEFKPLRDNIYKNLIGLGAALIGGITVILINQYMN